MPPPSRAPQRPDLPDSPSATSGGRLLGSALWASGGQVVQTLIALGGLVVLVRLLGAETYGLFAFGIILTGLADVLVGASAADIIVQRTSIDGTIMRATFTVVTGAAVVATLVIAALAGTAAAVFETPEFAEILPVMAVLPLLTGLAAVPNQLLVRAFRFDVLAKCTTASAAVAVGTGIAFAVAGAGVWSLILMEIARRLTILAIVVPASGFRPGFSRAWPAIVEAARFAWLRLENQLLIYISQDALPRLFVGGALGVSALGYFTICRRLLDQIHGILSGPAQAIAFPAIARRRGDAAYIRAILSSAIRLTTWVYWPATLGLIVVAPVLLPFAFGADWAVAVPALQLLAIGTLRVPLSSLNTAALVGFGRLRMVTVLFLIAIVVGAVTLSIGVQFGLVGAAAALAARQWLMWPVSATLVARVTQFSIGEQFAVATRSAVPAAVMAVTVAVAGAQLPPLAPAVELLILVSTGLATYGLAWTATYPRRAWRALQAARELASGNRSAARTSIQAALR